MFTFFPRFIMSNKKVVIIHSNALALNVRGSKEIEANDDEYDFIFLGWNRNKDPDSRFEKPANSEMSLLNVKAPYGKPYLVVMIFWWLYIFTWLMVKRWDMVHVMNIDCAPPVLLASKLKRKKSIYEILDTYEDSLNLPVNLRNRIINFDKWLMKYFNAIILVDEEQISEFGSIPNDNTAVIYDSPPEIPSVINKQNNECFTIFNAGNYHKDRKLNLDKIFEVVKELDHIKLIMAGFGDEESLNKIKDYENKMPDKISFIGPITYEEVIKLSCNADMLFQFRDTSLKINKYICGSTLFNAMASETPIIVNKGSSTAKKVLKENCGLVVDVNNGGEIRDAILKLKNDEELRKKLGKNARNAYDTKYSWKIMESRLKKLYSTLNNVI